MIKNLRCVTKVDTVSADIPGMTNSISSNHVSSAQSAAGTALPQATKANSPAPAAKSSPLPQDTVTLSSKSQSTTAAKGTADVDHDGDHH